MKNRINVLSFLSLITFTLLLLFSCAKEEIFPSNELNTASSIQAFDDTAESVDELPPDIVTNVENDPITDLNSLTEALQSIDFEEHANWGIDIKAFACTRSGHSLVVHNPNSPDLDFYDSRRYGVYWFKDGRPLVRSTKTRLECVCKGIYTAIVMYRGTQTAVGMASIGVGRCLPDTGTSVANPDF